MSEVNYLTEERLGEILEELFPKATITSQYKWNTRRKADYAIQMNFEDIPDSLVNKTDLDFVMHDYSEGNQEELDEEAEEQTFNPLITFLVEFDGIYHYTNPNTVERDFQYSSFSFKWDEVESFCYIMRIPYWIQLDSIMTEFIFGVNNDFSNGFKHGFVSKKCPLPATFCSAGLQRFTNEIKSLPDSVGKLVLDSIVEKFKTVKLNRILDKQTLDLLVSKFGNTSNFKKYNTLEYISKEGNINFYNRGKYFFKSKSDIKKQLEYESRFEKS